MKRVIRQFIISSLLIILIFSFQIYSNIHTFSPQNVISTINYLSSDHFKGRLTGTLENKEVEQYIKLQFMENNLKPYMGDYTQSFKVDYPKRVKGDPSLTITDRNGDVVKEFTYGVDYKEDMLNFKNNIFSFNKENPNIVSKDNILQIKQNSDYFLFYIPQKNDLNFRSSFMNTAQWSMCVMVTDKTLADIKAYLDQGYNINGFIPFTTAETNARNIMGYIEGRNKDLDPIIISSHFDHLGTDLKNTIYRGALDNASGTSFMLELSNYITSLGKPERSILFVAFNAEEFGCVGSAEFVKKYKDNIMDSKVYNFDMIGSDKGVPLCIVGGGKDTVKTSFLNSVSQTFAAEGIHFNYLFKDDSDHKAFRENNIDAVTFCDNDTTKIHTPLDTPDLISVTAIERGFSVVSKEIIGNAFNNNPLIIYYKEAFLGSAVLLISFMVFVLKRKNY